MTQVLTGQDVRRGQVKPFATKKGWNRKRVTFDPAFEEGTIPVFVCTTGEGSGNNNVGKKTIEYIGFESVTNKTATIALHEKSQTDDVVINWMALPPQD